MSESTPVFHPGLSASNEVTLRRLPRDKCEWCGVRRVLFALFVNRRREGMALCAICAQIR